MLLRGEADVSGVHRLLRVALPLGLVIGAACGALSAAYRGTQVGVGVIFAVLWAEIAITESSLMKLGSLILYSNLWFLLYLPAAVAAAAGAALAGGRGKKRPASAGVGCLFVLLLVFAGVAMPFCLAVLGGELGSLSRGTLGRWGGELIGAAVGGMLLGSLIPTAVSGHDWSALAASWRAGGRKPWVALLCVLALAVLTTLWLRYAKG